jgi:hypothetical protein
VCGCVGVCGGVCVGVWVCVGVCVGVCGCVWVCVCFLLLVHVRGFLLRYAECGLRGATLQRKWRHFGRVVGLQLGARRHLREFCRGLR